MPSDQEFAKAGRSFSRGHDYFELFCDVAWESALVDIAVGCVVADLGEKLLLLRAS